MTQALAAIAAAHDMGVLHRDLKPDNIVILQQVDDEGTATDLIKVCDFGIAKLSSGEMAPGGARLPPVALPPGRARRLTHAGMVIGTPAYMSPEQASCGEIDARSDIYSLGVILFELLTGRLPFDDPAPDVLARMHLTVDPPHPRDINPEVHPALAAVCMKALQKAPADRYAGARDMRNDLRAALATEASAGRPRLVAADAPMSERLTDSASSGAPRSPLEAPATSERVDAERGEAPSAPVSMHVRLRAAPAARGGDEGRASALATSDEWLGERGGDGDGRASAPSTSDAGPRGEGGAALPANDTEWRRAAAPSTLDAEPTPEAPPSVRDVTRSPARRRASALAALVVAAVAVLVVAARGGLHAPIARVASLDAPAAHGAAPAAVQAALQVQKEAEAGGAVAHGARGAGTNGTNAGDGAPSASRAPNGDVAAALSPSSIEPPAARAPSRPPRALAAITQPSRPSAPVAATEPPAAVAIAADAADAAESVRAVGPASSPAPSTAPPPVVAATSAPPPVAEPPPSPAFDPARARLRVGALDTNHVSAHDVSAALAHAGLDACFAAAARGERPAQPRSVTLVLAIDDLTVNGAQLVGFGVTPGFRACVVQRIGRARMPSADTGAATATIPLTFTDR